MVSRANILVVEDDAPVRFFLTETLTRDGHRVTPVDSGEAALERITQQQFDLVLVDLKLKGVGGIEVLAALRQKWPDAAAIVLTGYASLETAIEALRQDADDYLMKPVKAPMLRERVQAALRKRQEARRRVTPAEPEPDDFDAARFVQRGRLTVDFARHVILVKNHALDLSPTEFDVLAYLAQQAPRVVSSQELAREVQGYQSQPWEARDTVRYHIYRIRQKIALATGLTDVIRTVRGVGYAIDE